MLKFFNLLFISILFFSCSILSFEELSISTNIQDGKLNDKFIKIDFSLTPIKEDVEKIISLRENEKTIECYFEWQNNALIISPKENWKNESRYKLIISGNVKIIDGRNYSYSFSKSFHLNVDYQPFTLLSYISPTEINGNKSKLIFTFNKPVNINTFEKNFSIQPYLKVKKYFSNDLCSVEIIPETYWPVNKEIFWSLKDLASSEEDLLSGTCSDSFYVIKDIPNPELVSVNYTNDFGKNNENKNEVYNLNGISGRDSIVMKFSRKMNFTSIKNGFQITPYIDGKFYEHDDTVIFTPNSDYKINTEYKVKLSSSISDIYYLQLKDDIFFTFTSKNEYLRIEKISAESTILYSAKTFFNDIPIVKTADDSTLFLQINFSNPLTKDSKTKIDSFVQLTSFFPPTINSPKLTSAQWIGDDKVILSYENLSKSSETSNFYKLEIKAAVNSPISINNEYMEENICVVLKAE